MKRRTTVVVFARAPLPGRTKSRLTRAMGARQAALLHQRLLEHALATALASGSHVELHGFPVARNGILRKIARDCGVPLVRQRGADLGERMYRALVRGLRGSRSVILIGSDIPVWTVLRFRQAIRALASGRDVVLAPALDGGYGLIGVTRVARDLFAEMPWGAPDVYHRTEAALERLGFGWRALDAVWDLDRPEDLERLRSIRWRRSFSAGPRGARR